MDRPRYFGGRVKGTQLAVAAFILSLVLFFAVAGLGVFLIAHKTQTNAKVAEELRVGLVQNCRANGNPLREAVSKLIEEQIRNSESLVIQRIFPQIPPELLRAHVEADRQRLAEIAPVSCSSLYPKP